MNIRNTTLFATLILLAACATTPAENPPECAPVVARHQADPDLEVDVEARARSSPTVERVEYAGAELPRLLCGR